MRILLVTLYFYPDMTSANAVIMTELAVELARLGHEVTVVTSFPHYADSRIAPEYRGRWLQRDDYQGIRVIRTYLYTSPDKQNLAARLLNYLSFNLFSTFAGLLAGPCDVILVPSPPLTIGLSGWLLGRLKRAPYVYNVQDIYPDIAVRLGILTNPRLIRFFHWLEKFVYHRAAAVTVLSPGFKHNLLAKGVPVDKLHIIPNFVDGDFVRPLPKDNTFARRHGLHDKFVVMYAGNVGLSQGLEVALAAAAEISDLADLRLLVVGNGAAKAALEQQAQQQKLTNVIFLPFQPREIVPDLYATADVGMVSLRQDIGGESVPSKAYTIMASQRPLLAVVSEDTEIRSLIEAAACGLWVRPADPQALAGAIRCLYNNSVWRQQLGQNGRLYVERHHTPQAVASQYARLFKCLS